MTEAWFAIISIVIVYMAPSIIGSKKTNINAILALNILLGWTLIGWVVALTWALTKEEPKIIPKENNEAISITDELIKLKELKDNGTISHEEFDKLKNKLL